MEEKKQLLLALKRRRRRSTHTAFRSLSEYLWANTWNRCQFVNLRQVFTLFSSTDLETRQQHCHIHVQHEDPGHFSFNEINGWRTKIPKEHSVWKSPKMSHLEKTRQTDQFWHFWWTFVLNVDIARFARNVVKWDFFCDFQTLWARILFFFLSQIQQQAFFMGENSYLLNCQLCCQCWGFGHNSQLPPSVSMA